MSDYCNCCATNTEHIRQHYDPSAVATGDEAGAELLASFRACFPRESCPLRLADVETYLERLRAEQEEPQ